MQERYVSSNQQPQQCTIITNYLSNYIVKIIMGSWRFYLVTSRVWTFIYLFLIILMLYSTSAEGL